MIKRIRAVGMVVQDEKILLIKRRSEGKDFWVFPGGGVEDGEEIKNAVIRELTEETGIKAKIVKLLYLHIYPDIGHEQYFYLCEYVSGTPKLGDYVEMEKMRKSDQVYNPKWVKLSVLEDLLLYPLEIRDWFIQDFKRDFQDTPREAELLTVELRQ